MVARKIESIKKRNTLPQEIAAGHHDLKRRAADLSGRFRSGLQNLSTEHDRYLEESFGY